METRNAKIQSTMLGYEDHGIFTFMLYLDYGGVSQGAGGYSLDGYNKKEETRKGWKYGIDLLTRIMKVVGVDSWEKLKGKNIRVKSDHCKVYAIGNLLNDEWLNFDDFFKKQKE